MPHGLQVRVSDAVYVDDGSCETAVRIVIESENQRRRAAVAALYATQSIPMVLLNPDETTPDRAPEIESVARRETDWLNSASLFLPKSMREALLGDLLEERANWRAEGKSRLSIEGATVSQLLLSALALVWGAGKDLLVETVRRYRGL